MPARSVFPLAALLACGLPGLACSCVWTSGTTAKTELNNTHFSLVFRGRVVEKATLPRRREMGGRDRYAITFEVAEYWKGSPGQRVTLYGMDARGDCWIGDSYQVRKDYLVYAFEQEVRDEVIGGHFLWGWADVLPNGARMRCLDLCTFGGEISQVKDSIKPLGPGRKPD